MTQFANRRQVAQYVAIFYCLFAFSSSIQAECTSGVSYSPMNISHSMDVAVRSNPFNYLTVQETTETDTIYKTANKSKPAKLKSPTTALVIALVPGAVVHGAGHFYAGKTKTAVGLFGAEILGAGLTGLGLLGSLRGDTGGEGGEGGEVVIALGLGFFFGSWIYDIVESPSVIKRQNDQTPEKKPFPYELNMEFDKGNHQLKCLVVKHF